MCELCQLAEDPAYKEGMAKIYEDDKHRLEGTRELRDRFSWLPRLNFWDGDLYPFHEHLLFEWRCSHARANAFFQPLRINGEDVPRFFTHGATRGFFFMNDRVVLISKSPGVEMGIPFFKHFLSVSFKKSDLNIEDTPQFLRVCFAGTKPLINLVTGEKQEVHIAFNFVHVKLPEIQLRICFPDESPNQLTRLDVPANHLALHPFAERVWEQRGHSPKALYMRLPADFLSHLK